MFFILGFSFAILMNELYKLLMFFMNKKKEKMKDQIKEEHYKTKCLIENKVEKQIKSREPRGYKIDSFNSEDFERALIKINPYDWIEFSSECAHEYQTNERFIEKLQKTAEKLNCRIKIHVRPYRRTGEPDVYCYIFDPTHR